MLGWDRIQLSGVLFPYDKKEDKEVLKHFTKEQKRIRNEWKTRRAKQIKPEDMKEILEGFKKAFISMAGG